MPSVPSSDTPFGDLKISIKTRKTLHHQGLQHLHLPGLATVGAKSVGGIEVLVAGFAKRNDGLATTRTELGVGTAAAAARPALDRGGWWGGRNVW